MHRAGQERARALADLEGELQDLGARQRPRLRVEAGDAGQPRGDRLEGELAEDGHQRSPAAAGFDPAKAGITSRAKRRRLSSTSAWGITSCAFSRKFTRSTPHRLPALERAHDALRPTQAQSLAGLLARLGPGGLAAELGQEAERRIRPAGKDLAHRGELGRQIVERVRHLPPALPRHLVVLVAVEEVHRRDLVVDEVAHGRCRAGCGAGTRRSSSPARRTGRR